MTIGLRILCQKDAIASLARDADLAAGCTLDDTVFEMDADSPLFARFLERTTRTSGCWLNPVMAFTKSELAPVHFFQLEGRKLVVEGPGDYEANIARLRSRPFRHTGSFRMRVLDTLTLGRARLKPNEVACAGDWTSEFIVSATVGRLFEKEGLEGAELRPVIDPKSGNVYRDVGLLYSDRVLPLASLDPTTPPFEEGGEEGHRALACLSYDFAGPVPAGDFFRTAENWSSNDMPLWVVSRRVREVFERDKLRGWAFRPVLEVGSSLHTAYLEKWQQLMRQIAASNPGHFF